MLAARASSTVLAARASNTVMRRAPVAVSAARPIHIGLLPFVPFLWKQATMMNLYAALKQYGFPRVYRRIAEASRRGVPDAAQRRAINSAVKEAIRSPASALELARGLSKKAHERSATVRFLEQFAREQTAASAAADGAKKAPPSFVNIVADILIDKTELGKVRKIVKEATKK